MTLELPSPRAELSELARLAEGSCPGLVGPAGDPVLESPGESRFDRSDSTSLAVNPLEYRQGSSRSGDKEFAKFVQIAIGSATEVEYQLQFAVESGVAPEESTLKLIESDREVRRMLIGLMKRLR